MEYTSDFVIKVNEIYHDVEGREYEGKHPEIFTDDVKRWRDIGSKFIANSHEQITLLDIGTGTGFIPLQIGRILKANDICVCSDVSREMLEVCKENLRDKDFRCCFDYLRLDGKKFDLESNYFTHITLNSVLHHIPDFGSFFKEINRLLRVQGRLIIGHEPNELFYTNTFLRVNSRLFYVIMNPKSIVHKSRRLGLIKRPKKDCKGDDVHISNQQRISEGVNKRLMDEGMIEEPLTAKQIIEIVDFHVPSSRLVYRRGGISISELLRDYLPNYELEYYETYCYLGSVSTRNWFTKKYDSLLKKLFPDSGSLFSTVLKKAAH